MEDVYKRQGKCCVSGAGDIVVDYAKRNFSVNGTIIKEGDWISLNGSTGEVYLGKVETEDAT